MRTPPFEERIIVAALFDIPVQRYVVNKDIKNKVTVFKMRFLLLPTLCLRISTTERNSSSTEEQDQPVTPPVGRSDLSP